ncbi:MAG: hypothetical protein OEV65_03940 [Aquincola sp.]|nr:hypothetical protein [Aquincola sp.]
MTTRYSLPRDAQRADTARGARMLASLVLVATVVALALIGTIAAGERPSMATVPAEQSAPPVAATAA